MRQPALQAGGKRCDCKCSTGYWRKDEIVIYFNLEANMNFLLWRIDVIPERIAKIQRLLYRFFGIKRKYPCGRNKETSYLCCMLHPNSENSIVINDEGTHEIRCRVCGSIHMMSNEYIDPDGLDDDWMGF